MQRGSVERHGAGWRGRFGRPVRRSTETCPRKGQATAALDRELRGSAPELITGRAHVRWLAGMYLAKHSGTAATVVSVDRRLRRPLGGGPPCG